MVQNCWEKIQRVSQREPSIPVLYEYLLDSEACQTAIELVPKSTGRMVISPCMTKGYGLIVFHKNDPYWIECLRHEK